MPAGRGSRKPGRRVVLSGPAAAGPRALTRSPDATGQTVLVQPFLTSIPTEGEWPMIFVDGRFSYAASKGVALPQAGTVDDLFAAETNTEHVASAAQLEVAQAAIDLVSDRLGTPTYARVDLVRDDAGQFCVLELELVEPSLFLPYADPVAAERFVAALVR